MTQEYLNFAQAQHYLGFKSSKALREYISEGLPVIKVGKSRRISKTDIDKFMQEHVVTNKESNSDAIND